MKLYRSRNAVTNAFQKNIVFSLNEGSQSPSSHHFNVKDLVDARSIKTGFDPNTCRSNFQLKNFVSRGQVSQARELFEQMPQKNTCSTNMLISGYVKSGDLSIARELFDGMADPTAVSWTILIGGYSQHNQSVEAFKLYGEMCTWVGDKAGLCDLCYFVIWL